MQRPLLLTPFAVAFVLAACSSASSPEEDAPMGPAPTDPVVFEASAETKKDIGVAKWGFDDATGVSVFHGYDAKNAQVLELQQSLEEAEDSFTKRVVMKMTGRLGEASAVIEVGVVVNADLQGATYTNKTIQNTFDGRPAGKVLAHLGPDSAAIVTKAAGGGEGLVQAKSVQPMAGDSGALVGGQSELLMCCSELTSATAALSANAGMSCALTPGGQSSMISGQSIRPLAIVRQNGRLTVASPWAGPYNIVDNHCHNAAASNSSKTDGYVGCHSTSSTTSYAGHTINWAPNPYQSANNFCAYEPQANNGTIASGSICCFRDTAQSNGAPSLASRDAQSCISKLCLGQADFTLTGSARPQAFPAGSTPPVPNDCPSSTTTLGNCNVCCSNLATQISNSFPGNEFKAQIAGYRARCAANCQQAETVRNPPPPSNPCAPSILQWLQARTNRSTACSYGGGTGGDGGTR